MKRYFGTSLIENRRLEAGYYVLVLAGNQALDATVAGQFVMLRGDWGRDPLLPRAFSLLRAGGGRIEILAKTVGRGTALLERAPAGATMALLGPLGTPLPAPADGVADLLVAGGVGLAPLLMYAERHPGARRELLYGARSRRDLVLLADCEASGARLRPATEDGSLGFLGLVAGALEARLDAAAAHGEKARVLACGPNAMLDAVRKIAAGRGVPCFVSLEGEMACGIGACLGCAVAARSKPYRYVCKDGPVFDCEDLL
jgi:dihydroorotate dehydrogenase electron transfer subunit